MPDLGRRQHSNNEESRDRWDTFAEHRMKVLELLRPDPGSGLGRLCVLGAGNCNDLELPSLLELYGEVHLVDLDADALARGVARQGLSEHPGLHCRGDVDVTGMLDVMSGWSPDAVIGPDDLRACSEGPVRRVVPALADSFDVVASTCLLTQLIQGIVASVGERHSGFLGLLQATRSGHFQLLARLLNPGGVALMITDVVSTETCPELLSVPEQVLGGLLNRLLRDRNFFHGVNPMILSSIASSDPLLGREIALHETFPPWRWHLGPRTYLVCAMKFRKSQSART